MILESAYSYKNHEPLAAWNMGDGRVDLSAKNYLV